MQRLTDLREILRYVPHFRDKVFVIALDGAVVADDNFANLLLDIALLRSLRIGVVLVHGAGFQIDRLARTLGREPSNADGTGVTDAATLELALTAANRATHDIFEGLAGVDLRAAAGNALVAHPDGILGGVDHQLTGRVERVDVGLLQALLEREVVPVVPPLGFDGEGHTYRLNSDAVHFYPDSQQAELAYLFVADRFGNQGVGAKLAQYAETVARALAAEQLFCLSTQAFNFFVQKAGFRPASPDVLPPARRERYD